MLYLILISFLQNNKVTSMNYTEQFNQLTNDDEIDDTFFQWCLDTNVEYLSNDSDYPDSFKEYFITKCIWGTRSSFWFLHSTLRSELASLVRVFCRIHIPTFFTLN